MNLGLREAVTLGDALSVALREGREDELDEWRPPIVPRHCVWSRSLTGLLDSRLPRRLFGRCATWRCASSHSCRQVGEA
jgi:hypothetical protein